MSSSSAVLFAAVFIASAVEMVEALTIVLAVGVTRGFRSALEGVVAALVILAAIVVAFGPLLVNYVPLNLLRLIVGGVLLIFGLQWMRKAVLRASGFKEKRNEDAVYSKTVSELSGSKSRNSRDAQGFVVAFKGVFIEGLEVVIIVLTLGTSSHDLNLAVASAFSAFAIVALVGVVVSRQLSGVPENLMKLAVGTMLISFGTFWGGEGLGLAWPGNDLMIPILVVVYGLIVFGLVKIMAGLERKNSVMQTKPASKPELLKATDYASVSGAASVVRRPVLVKISRAFGKFWWDFFIGDTPEVFIGTVVIFVLGEYSLRFSISPTLAAFVGPSLVTLLLLVTVGVAFSTEMKKRGKLNV